jgi:hypothetical protein
MKFAISFILIATLAPVAAIAQTNASNSSGMNVTSYGGTSGSIWGGNRNPVITEPNPGTKVFVADEPKPPVFDLGQPVEVRQPEQKLIPPVACGDEHAACPGKKAPTYKPTYKPAIKKAPKARG